MKEEIRKWFKDERGIEPETLERFGITYDEQDKAIVFPYGRDREKRRYGLPNGTRNFRFTKGSSLDLFNSAEIQGKKTVFICEGETDTLRLSQEIGFNKPDIAVVGLPGVGTWQEEWAKYFKDVENVWIVLDRDADYNVAFKTDNYFHAINKSLSYKSRRIVLPSGTKDICEFFDRYDLDGFKLLVRDTAKGKFDALDLTKPPPPVTWLVDKLIAQGDIVLLVGEPSAGKSWLSMHLTLQLIQDQDRWLNHEVETEGKVLYFDEENPLDVVYSRFQKLGLRPDSVENLKFIHNHGIKLDRNRDDLLEEVAIFKPSLVVFDSLTRLHDSDENNSGVMANLFNESVRPISRDSKASVLLLHHVGKGEGSSYRRARGSGDIVASVDCAIDVRPISPGLLSCYVFKSRRGIVEDPIIIKIEDNGPDQVRLIEVENYDPF